MTLSSRAGALLGAAFLTGALGTGVTVALVGDHQPADAPVAAAPPASSTRPVSNPAQGTAKQVYATSKDSVAFISATSAQGQATGSGFVVTADGKIITNEHVVDGAQQVTVKVGTDGAQLPARVLAADASKDLALLQVDTGAQPLKPLRLADSSKVQVGDGTYAIGNPYGLDHTLTSGIVSALGRDIQAPDGTTIANVIQTDAAINPGNSGGALLDTDGRVIGVNSQIASAGSSGGGQAGNVGIGFAIPSNTVAAFLANPTSTQATTPDQPVDPYADPSQGYPDPSQGYPDPSQGYPGGQAAVGPTLVMPVG